ncbi:hypothetical protein HPB50_022135 [Hyalomma asiaticum]|uniref:Uncharacterized protein n=1 Tax=Hyalomma asiaticum TaxID=266040 RepID=A0ACB7SQ00_HYAAI|nr:hypothetical protein HPB50_022135 [Hyalomma asiaticum]
MDMQVAKDDREGSNIRGVKDGGDPGPETAAALVQACIWTANRQFVEEPRSAGPQALQCFWQYIKRQNRRTPQRTLRRPSDGEEVEEELQELLDICGKEMGRIRLHFSPTKCVVMVWRHQTYGQARRGDCDNRLELLSVLSLCELAGEGCDDVFCDTTPIADNFRLQAVV